MNLQSAVPFAGERRVHLGLEVADLARSIAFYRILLGADPVKVRPGYAKFEPADPAVNLSLNEGSNGPRPGGSQHFGVQVQSTEAVERAVEQFARAGIAIRVERGTECCYAVQDKVWVEDPDGNPWEVFVVTRADAGAPATTTSEGGGCCVPGGSCS